MLKSPKKHKLQDLIEKIQEADAMIRLHSSNPTKFMLQQYEAKKEKLLGDLTPKGKIIYLARLNVVRAGTNCFPSA
jgi:hypothetical protein